MFAETEDITRSVLLRYGLEVSRIEPMENGMYRVDTDRGGKWLHVYDQPETARLKFKVTEHLAKQGFRRIPRFIRTVHGDPYVQTGDRVYALTDAWDGRKPEYTATDLRLAAVNLAELHQALGDACPGVDEISTRHGTWLQTFRKCRDHLVSTVSDWNGIGKRDDFQEVFLNYAPWISGVMEESLEQLLRGGYEEKAREHEAKKSICYGEYRLEDLCVAADGKIATLGFQTVAGDMPLYDVARFCHNLLEEGQGVYLPVVLSAYEEKRKLDEEDKVILAGYLNFPHTVYRIMDTYLRMSRQPETFVHLLQQAIDRWRVRQPYVLGAFRYETS
jgi:CotS family spore coat protein